MYAATEAGGVVARRRLVALPDGWVFEPCRGMSMGLFSALCLPLPTSAVLTVGEPRVSVVLQEGIRTSIFLAGGAESGVPSFPRFLGGGFTTKAHLRGTMGLTRSSARGRRRECSRQHQCSGLKLTAKGAVHGRPSA